MLVKSIQKKGQIVIPKAIREMLGLREGSEVMINLRGEEIIIKKKETIEDFFNEMDKMVEEKGIEVKKIDLDTLYENQLEERHNLVPRR